MGRGRGCGKIVEKGDGAVVGVAVAVGVGVGVPAPWQEISIIEATGAPVLS